MSDTPSKTDEVLAKALEAALEAAKTTGNFVVEQAPDVVQQLLLFNTVAYTVKTVLFSTITTVGFVVAAKLFRKSSAQAEAYANSHTYMAPDGFSSFMLGGVSCGVGGAALVATCNQLLSLLKITLAPKVWLIEYAASLVK